MRKVTFILSLVLVTTLQAQHPVVQSIVDAVNIDSMLHYVRELSGELAVDVGAGPEFIVSRHKYNEGNAKAEAYLVQKLLQFGYSPTVQTFSATGANVIAVKPGITYPDELVVLCAHYDAMPAGFLAAPAADDDGSGCGALLEAARILSDIDFEYSIAFAFWDEEEQGLVGSAFYAGGMAASDEMIRGVINMDAIAYDGNGDTKARIHTRPIANSFELADSVFAMRDNYGIDLDLLLTVPGATYSDHASFWNNGYGAILIIEEFTNDGNPYYHTPNDLVEHFDIPYYEKLAKLSIATLATIAVPLGDGLSVPARTAHALPGMYAYPNPANDNAQLWVDVVVPGSYRMALLDAMGRELAILHDGMLPMGKQTFTVQLEGLAQGAYLVLMQAEGVLPRTLRMVRAQ